VGDEGLKLLKQCRTFRDSEKCAAALNALGPDFGPIDADLAEVILAWPHQSNAVKGRIAWLVAAAGYEE
jgi:hypothetical protein